MTTGLTYHQIVEINGIAYDMYEADRGPQTPPFAQAGVLVRRAYMLRAAKVLSR